MAVCETDHRRSAQICLLSASLLQHHMKTVPDILAPFITPGHSASGVTPRCTSAICMNLIISSIIQSFCSPPEKTGLWLFFSRPAIISGREKIAESRFIIYAGTHTITRKMSYCSTCFARNSAAACASFPCSSPTLFLSAPLHNATAPMASPSQMMVASAWV